MSTDTVIAVCVCVPACLLAVMAALADLAPDMFGWVERAILKIPGLQRAWDAYFRVFMAAWTRISRGSTP